MSELNKTITREKRKIYKHRREFEMFKNDLRIASETNLSLITKKFIRAEIRKSTAGVKRHISKINGYRKFDSTIEKFDDIKN